MDDKEKLFKALFGGSDERQQRLKDPNQQLVELEMKKRLIKAKELGRVIPEKIPDFIGNFDNGYPRGIFEMFIEEREGSNISGTIKDCYGTATFKGVLSETEISFTKHYLLEQSSVDASKNDFNYKGECSPSTNEYFGRFTDINHPRYNGAFWISRDLSSQ